MSSSYAKILGQKLFRTRGQKQKMEKKEEEREKDWTMVITMAKLRMAHASRLGQKTGLHEDGEMWTVHRSAAPGQD